jgi:hypothetical protein
MITTRRKIWLGLGTFGFLGGLVGAMPLTPRPVRAAEKKEGGEGGEGGEQGIDAAQAAKDPTVFLVALDVIAAHYLAGRDAYAAGETEAAAEMFAHPIAEVYVDLEPVLKARGIKPFDARMKKASELALAKAPKPRIDKAVDDVLAALKAAAAKAPRDRRKPAAIEARVIADMLDRASLQYATAAKETTLEPYLDGYGFYRAAERRAGGALQSIAAASPEVAEATRTSLALLARAYPSAARPPSLPVTPGELLPASARVKLTADAMR